MKRLILLIIGWSCVGLAFLGIFLPGIPTTPFLIVALWAFAKSSPKMEDWLYNHPWFGKFLTNWNTKRVFPTKGKYAMVIVMASTLAFTWFGTGNANAVMYSGLFMAGVAVWAWRYPGSVEEHTRRVEAGERVAWLR